MTGRRWKRRQARACPVRDHPLRGVRRTTAASPITDRNGTKRRQYRCSLMSADGPGRGVDIGADIAKRAAAGVGPDAGGRPRGTGPGGGGPA